MNLNYKAKAFAFLCLIGVSQMQAILPLPLAFWVVTNAPLVLSTAAVVKGLLSKDKAKSQDKAQEVPVESNKEGK
jgi:hypothetical protein